MTKTAAQLQARLNWEIACERLAFALSPPDGTQRVSQGELDLEIERVRVALEDLGSAFRVDAAPPSG